MLHLNMGFLAETEDASVDLALKPKLQFLFRSFRAKTNVLSQEVVHRQADVCIRANLKISLPLKVLESSVLIQDVAPSRRYDMESRGGPAQMVRRSGRRAAHNAARRRKTAAAGDMATRERERGTHRFLLRDGDDFETLSLSLSLAPFFSLSVCLTKAFAASAQAEKWKFFSRQKKPVRAKQKSQSQDNSRESEREK